VGTIIWRGYVIGADSGDRYEGASFYAFRHCYSPVRGIAWRYVKKRRSALLAQCYRVTFLINDGIMASSAAKCARRRRSNSALRDLMQHTLLFICLWPETRATALRLRKHASCGEGMLASREPSLRWRHRRVDLFILACSGAIFGMLTGSARNEAQAFGAKMAACAGVKA